MEYIKRKDALKILGISYVTLYKIAKNKEIETIKIGSNTLYNVNKYLRNQNITKIGKRKICYCRVSSNKQKDDLDRQIDYMKDKFPTHEIIKDIGSGLNNKRKGMIKLMELAINGEIEEVVITYKDRLSRFGYDMIEWIIEKYSGGRIIIINKKEEETPTEEITKDIISIMNVYVAKVNGLRKYTKLIKEDIQK